jgi:hypothetical protein
VQSKAAACRPSKLIGLKSKSLGAYFLDEAVIYFGLQLENMLEEAGYKPSKEERKAKQARERIIALVFGEEENTGSGFADPAAMFG